MHKARASLLFLCFGIAMVWTTSTAAQTTLIERDLNALGDKLITLDTSTGFEWLDVTATNGLSYNAAESTPFVTVQGFRHATADEVHTLFTNAGISIFGSVTVPENFAAAQELTLKLGCNFYCDPTFNFFPITTGFSDYAAYLPPDQTNISSVQQHPSLGEARALAVHALPSVSKDYSVAGGGNFLVRSNSCASAFEAALCDSLLVVSQNGGTTGLVVQARFNDGLPLNDVLALSREYSLRTSGRDEAFASFNWIQIGVEDNFGFSGSPFLDPALGGNLNQIVQCLTSPARDFFPWYWDEINGGTDLCTPPGPLQESQAGSNNTGTYIQFDDKPNLRVPGRSLRFNTVLVGVYGDFTGKVLSDIPGVQFDWTFTQTSASSGDITVSIQNTDPAAAGEGDVTYRVLEESELTPELEALIDEAIAAASASDVPIGGPVFGVVLAGFLGAVGLRAVRRRRRAGWS